MPQINALLKPSSWVFQVKEHPISVAKIVVIGHEKGSLKQQAVYLIESIVAIVILVMVAIPEFIDLSGDTETTALEAVVGAIDSAAALNYVAAKAGDVEAIYFSDGVDSCDSMIKAILVEGALPSGYTTATTLLTQNDGDIVNCPITQATNKGPRTLLAKLVWVE